MQHLDGVFAIQCLVQFNVAAIVWVEILVHTTKRYRVTVRFDLQNQLDEVTQLQRLPESLRRLVGDKIAVFCYRQQFIATAFAGFGCGHFTRQGSETFNVFTDCHQHDINRFQELLAVQIFQNRQIDARATFRHFLTQTIKTFFQQ